MAMDKIDLNVIKSKLKTTANIIFYETTDSTNLRLKEMASSGAEHGTVIIAENQTSGRGRLGRQFYSPTHSGIYMSLLLRPEKETDTGLITAYTAVAVCRALEKVYSAYKKNDLSISHDIDKHGENNIFGIKWVNDIQKNGKKICGILAESGIENGKIDYIIVGIGINVYPPEEGFPKDIENIAGSVFDNYFPNARNEIISEIIDNFYNFSHSFISEYKRKSVVIGKQINVHQNNEVKKALAIDIDNNCNLIVKYENGTTESLSFGEISIRIAQKE